MSQKFLLEDGTTLEMVEDTEPANPRKEWDNLGTMVCFHKRYSLGDTHDFKSEQFGGWADMKKKLISKLDVAVILPLYMYDHSGLTIKTTPFDCPWDSGQIGYIYVTKEEARKQYEVKRLTKQKLALIEKVLLAEVETYDQYLTGDVYGYRLFDSNGTEIADVWGFYGSDPNTNGIMGNLNSPILREI
jgi:hypothetical protein